jgi:hypothetical protein
MNIVSITEESKQEGAEHVVICDIIDMNKNAFLRYVKITLTKCK